MFALTSSKEVVFVAQELAAVCLSEHGDTGRVEASSFGGAATRDAESEGSIVHVVHNNALVLGAVVRPAANVRLDDVAAVQERHFTVALDPDLPAGVLGEDGQRGNVQSELATLGELAYRESRVSARSCAAARA